MTHVPEYNSQKALLLLSRLQQSARRYQQREEARVKLTISLERLRRISAKSVQRYVDELEQRIALALVREQQVRHAQSSQEALHKGLAHKIDALGQKMDRYVRTRAAREKRIEQLERKIRAAFETRKASLAELRAMLRNAEKLHAAALRSDPKDAGLKRLGTRLKRLRARIKK